LDNTYIVFTSDNGFHLGQHRLPAGKQTAYETDIHLPLLVRGPGVPAGAHVTALAGNVDLAPTFAALGGATMADNPDGRSLVPFLQHPDQAVASWRQAYLLEHWTQTSTGPATPGGPQLEPDDLDQSDASDTATDDTSSSTTSTTAPRTPRAAATNIPEFQGLRVAGYAYVEYATGERELYDLRADPDELDNLAATANPALLDALHQRLDELRACVGESCRTAEGAALVLPS